MCGGGIAGVDAPLDGHQLGLQLGDGLVGLLAFLERLSVPAVLALDRGHALAFERPGQNHGRVVLGGLRGGKRVQQRLDVVAVHDERVPAERVPARGDLVHPMVELRVLALTEPVHVDYAAEVVELVKERHVSRFPHRAFGHLAVAEEHVGAVVGLDAPRVERRADRGADALAERARRHVDKRQSRRRVPLEVGVEPAQLEQLGAGKEAGVRPGRIQNRRRVPLRQHEAVVVGILRILRIEAHLAEKERRDNLGRGHAGRRVTAPGLGRRLDRIDAELGGEVFQGRNRFRRSHFVQESLSQVRVGSRLAARVSGRSSELGGCQATS